MSCRHDLAGTTCSRCYPGSGSIDPGPERDYGPNLDGPGAVPAQKANLTPSRLRLAAHLLRMAVDEFSGHGCNDFHLAEVVPDVNARRALMKLYHELNGDPKEFNAASSYEYAMDFCLMSLMADLLERAAEEAG